jgi:hypothetical protein
VTSSFPPSPLHRAAFHPAIVAAIAVLVINDHVLKARFGTWWTGKLSDVAGLMFFPALLALAAHHLAGARDTIRTLALAAAATALVFAAIKLWWPAGEVYRYGLAALQWPARAIAAACHGDPTPRLHAIALVRDPSDLLALPAVLVPMLIAGLPARHAARRVAAHAG